MSEVQIQESSSGIQYTGEILSDVLRKAADDLEGRPVYSAMLSVDRSTVNKESGLHPWMIYALIEGWAENPW